MADTYYIFATREKNNQPWPKRPGNIPFGGNPINKNTHIGGMAVLNVAHAISRLGEPLRFSTGVCLELEPERDLGTARHQNYET